MPSALARCRDAIRKAEFVTRIGHVSQYAGSVVSAIGPDVSLGEICEIYPSNRLGAIAAEAVGFRDGKVLLMPLDDLRGVRPGDEILATGRNAHIAVGPGLLGRIVDAFGRPLDGEKIKEVDEYRPLYAKPINPVHRARIDQVFETRVKALDSLLTVGVGQRVGIFSGSGVGKSTLMGMVAQNSQADVNVIALIGERGRELRDFVETHLGEARKKSVVLIATSEQSALFRMHAAFAATAVAEYFRDQGKTVLLMMDSLTRFAMAQREIGLAVGEPPTTRGYTPSVFTVLPKLLERAGNGNGKGSITGFYTVLVEGDDLNEPIADHARATLDGHFILSREIANRGRFPAIDPLKSISRLASHLASVEDKKIVADCIECLALHEDAKDIVNLGAYKRGVNKKTDRALDLFPKIDEFLRQDTVQAVPRPETMAQLRALLTGGAT